MKEEGFTFSKKDIERALHLFLLLLGICLIIAGLLLSDKWESILLGVGASIVATAVVYFSLSTVLGDPLSSIMEKLRGSVEVLDRASKTGLVSVWTQRIDLPTNVWIENVKSAKNKLDFLGYAMAFLPEHPEFAELLLKKAKEGCKIRILLGVPDSECVIQRNKEEKNEGSISGRIRTSLDRLRPLQGIENVEIRLHETPLYCSIYQYDIEMLVTPHLYGLRGSAAPLLCIKRTDEKGLFSKYEGHFQTIWELAQPYQEEL